MKVTTAAHWIEQQVKLLEEGKGTYTTLAEILEVAKKFEIGTMSICYMDGQKDAIDNPDNLTNPADYIFKFYDV